MHRKRILQEVGGPSKLFPQEANDILPAITFRWCGYTRRGHQILKTSSLQVYGKDYERSLNKCIWSHSATISFTNYFVPAPYEVLLINVPGVGQLCGTQNGR